MFTFRPGNKLQAQRIGALAAVGRHHEELRRQAAKLAHQPTPKLKKKKRRRR